MSLKCIFLKNVYVYLSSFWEDPEHVTIVREVPRIVFVFSSLYFCRSHSMKPNVSLRSRRGRRGNPEYLIYSPRKTKQGIAQIAKINFFHTFHECWSDVQKIYFCNLRVRWISYFVLRGLYYIPDCLGRFLAMTEKSLISKCAGCITSIVYLSEGTLLSFVSFPVFLWVRIGKFHVEHIREMYE